MFSLFKLVKKTGREYCHINNSGDRDQVMQREFRVLINIIYENSTFHYMFIFKLLIKYFLF